MDILEILQTIGICAGSLALVGIAVMMFLIVSSFAPIVPYSYMEDEGDVAESGEAPKRSRRTKKSKE